MQDAYFPGLWELELYLRKKKPTINNQELKTQTGDFACSGHVQHKTEVVYEGRGLRSDRSNREAFQLPFLPESLPLPVTNTYTRKL